MLVDSQFQRGLQHRSCVRQSIELKKDFSEKNARHHPVRFFRGAKFEMQDGIAGSALRLQSLCQGEAKKLVVRLTSNEGLELVDA